MSTDDLVNFLAFFLSSVALNNELSDHKAWSVLYLYLNPRREQEKLKRTEYIQAKWINVLLFPKRLRKT